MSLSSTKILQSAVLATFPWATDFLLEKSPNVVKKMEYQVSPALPDCVPLLTARTRLESFQSAQLFRAKCGADHLSGGHR